MALVRLFNAIADAPMSVRFGILGLSGLEQLTINSAIHQWATQSPERAWVGVGYYALWIVLYALVAIGFWRDHGDDSRPFWPAFARGGEL